MTLQHKARDFAALAHAGQKRKYTGDPYIIHPEAVAALVRTVEGHTDEMVAAAYLHDTLEDTQTTYEQILAAFGPGVADLVRQLTDVSTPDMGNRATRKAIDREHLRQASAAAQTIKLADLMDNTASITQYDPHFSRVYLNEKKLLLEVLTKGDPGLHKQASQMLER